MKIFDVQFVPTSEHAALTIVFTNEAQLGVALVLPLSCTEEVLVERAKTVFALLRDNT